MGDPREDTRTPAERRAAEAVAALPAERPGAAYRARVAGAFAAGTLKSAVRTRSAFATRAPWGAFAAAAGLVAVAFALNRGPDWSVLGVTGDGVAVVDGTPLPSRSPELARAVRRGAHIVLPQGLSLDLVAPGQVAASLAGGTDIVLPASPNRWWSREAHGRVTLGSAYLETGRDFHGAQLVVDTPEASARVVGTALAVLRDAEAGTCVCVMEGNVSVTAGRERERYSVPAGQRCICPVTGEAQLGSILHSSEHALHALGARSAAALGR